MDIDTHEGDGTVSAGTSAGGSSTTVPLDAQMGDASGADWLEEVYQKIKSMKEMYYSELNDLYQKIASKVQKHDSLPLSNEKIEKLKMFKMPLERILLFLRLNKLDIQLAHKEKLLVVEKHINLFLSAGPGKPTSSPLQGQLPQSSMQLQQPQSLDGVSTIYNSQQHMINTVQPGSGVATGILPQYPVNSPQLVNISSYLAHANLGFLQQNSSILGQSFFELHEQQMLQNQQLRQMQQQPFHRQQIMQHQQLLHRHQLMQQQQLMLQQQAMQQQTVQLQAHQMSQLHQMTDDSSAQTGSANGADWQEEVYQKAQNTHAHQTPTMDSGGQDIASEFDRLLSLID